MGVFLNTNNKNQAVYDIDGNVIEYIDANSVEKSKLGINFFGENVLPYADKINENFVRIIQNFYGKNPPLKPVKGQYWYSEFDNKLYLWDGYSWKQITKDKIFRVNLIVKNDIKNKEVLIRESIFKLGIENVMIFDQDMNKVVFTFDPNNFERILIKSPNVKDVYVLIFHPNDKVSNPYFNKKIEIIADINSQTQFDISEIAKGNKISNLSVKINDELITPDDFYVENNILNLKGKLFNIKKGDVVKIWKYGGSLKRYEAEIKIRFEKETDVIKIPKFFEKIKNIRIFDILNKSMITPLYVEDKLNYFEIKLLNPKQIETEIEIEII